MTHNGIMDVQKAAIHTPQAPAAIGPYSQAVAAGPWVFTSGQVGLVPATGRLIAGEVEAEAEQALSNLRAILQAAGCGFAQVVKTTVFLADMGLFQRVNAVYERFFASEGAPFPARSTVQVARLPLDAQVEIEAVALRLP